MNTLIEGKPGVGKTYLSFHLAHAWMESDQDYQLKNMRLVVFIRPNDIKDSFESTIMAALKGSEKEKHIMFAFLKQHPKRCCIIVDALDEMSSNVKVMNELFDMMENKACFFIITCRTEHPVLDRRMNLFQRVVQVVGFDEPDVIPFITQFLTSPGEELPTYGEAMCTVVSQSPKLLGLCCNPLVACLLCLLIAERQLEVEDLGGLTLLEIYKKIEDLILLRENKVTDEKLLREMNCLHRLALNSLLQKKYSYSEVELATFGIMMDSSVLVFLQKQESSSLWAASEVSFFWLHRSFMEFAAAMAINSYSQHVKEILICYICSKRELNHVSHFLGHLFQDDEHLLGLVCSATLVLQQELPKNPNCEGCIGEVQSRLSNKFEHIEGYIKEDDFSFGTDLEVESISDLLRPCPCFKDNQSIDPNKGMATIHHAIRCLLSARSPDVQKRLAQTVLDRTMPIKW